MHGALGSKDVTVRHQWRIDVVFVFRCSKPDPKALVSPHHNVFWQSALIQPALFRLEDVLERLNQLRN